MGGPNVELVGYESGRRLHTLALQSPYEFPNRIDLSSPRFICLVAWDAENASVDAIALLARKILDNGGVYVCAWGRGCERVHDIVDEVRLEAPPSSDGESVVMTTWHDEEPLPEAIWFSLFSAWPDNGYSDGCGAILGLSIASEIYDSEIRSAFKDPKKFSVSIVEE